MNKSNFGTEAVKHLVNFLWQASVTICSCMAKDRCNRHEPGRV